MNKKLLEEINRFRMISSYQPGTLVTEHNLLNEQDPFEEYNPSEKPGILRGDENQKRGELQMGGVINGVSTYGVFKNRGFIPNLSKRDIIGIRTMSHATSRGIMKPSEPVVNINKDTGTDVASIDVKASAEDPFEFDSITPTTEGERALIYFINTLKDIKENKPEAYQEYLKFLNEKKPIYVKAYSSKDGDPTQKIGGKYQPCKGYGNGTRGDYDKCLSNERAKFIVNRLETELPDFKGIFSPVGYGQTTKFNGKGWPNTTDTNETKPNRRFEITLPSFTYSTTTPKPEQNTENKPKTIVQNNKVYGEERTLTWNISDAIPTVPDGISVKCKLDQNGFIVVDIKEIIGVFGGKEELQKHLPQISAGKFNDDTEVNAVLNQNGIVITTKEGSFEWSKWGTDQSSQWNYDAIKSTNFRPVVISVRGTDLYIKDMAFALVKISKKR